MKLYILSLGAGLLVGILYSLLNVRSPAPPVVALVGLLGILAGEQVIPMTRHMLAGGGVARFFAAEAANPAPAAPPRAPEEDRA